MSELMKYFESRRSIYAISKASPLSDEKIEKLIQDALKHTPSPFNMQSQRVILLLGKQHDLFWGFVMDALRAKVDPKKFADTEKKINGFAAGYGTVLYFDDTQVTNHFANEFKSYKDKFPIWAQQSNGMLQYAVWTLLESEGLGASLQHYNPMIDEAVRKEWNVPEHWELVAQMPFGKPTAPAGEKEFQPIAERFKLFS